MLRAGGLVAFPTETVYGLGANALDAAAVRRIFQAKGRPAEDPVIVHVLGLADLEVPAAGRTGGTGETGGAREIDGIGAARGDRLHLVAALTPVARRLAAAFWPGPLTLIFRRGPDVPDIVTAGRDSVAVRAPSHPVARALLAAAAVPIAAPSANPFGRTSPTTAAHVAADLGAGVDLILDGGPSEVGVESTIVDARTEPPVVLRPGGVALEALRAVVPGIQVASARGSSGPQLAPGQLQRHYAPRARLTLVRSSDEIVETLETVKAIEVNADGAVVAALQHLARAAIADGRRVGILVAEEDLPALADLPPGVVVLAAGPRSDLAVVARHLFGTLRAFDEAGVEVILARDFGTHGLGLAIRDRLQRAAEGRVVVI